MSKIILYSVDEILKYKSVNILTEDLSNIFDTINNSFLQSTQYIENRKKINYNQLNSNKWKKINSNINTKLLSLLNNITNETFSNVLEKILNSQISHYSQIDKLSLDIFNKILIDVENNKLYCSIIKQIVDSGLWYFKDEPNNVQEFVNFRIYFVEKLNLEYTRVLESLNSLAELLSTDEDKYYNIKIRFNAMINTIINLHKLNILSDSVMNSVVDSLMEKYSSGVIDVIEYLCNINSIHNYEDVEIFLRKQLENPDLPMRYKFLIQDLNKKVEPKKETINVMEEYKKFLTDSNLDSLKKHVGGKINYLELIGYVFEKFASITVNELDKYLNLVKKIKERMDKSEYAKFLEENLDELIIEFPLLEKYRDKF